MKTFSAEAYIPEGMSLGIFRARASHGVLTHRHDFLEFVYVSAGSARQLINGTPYDLARGDLLFINYGSTHTVCSPSPDFEYYNLSFNPDLIAERIINRQNAFDLLSLTALDELRGGDGAGGRITFYGKEQTLVETILADMLDEFESDRKEKRAVLESYMTVFIAKVTRKISPSAAANGSASIWDELTEYISANLDKRLTLSGIARQCFYNPSYFSRAFKERFGTTLVDYIGRERAALAARLLTETDMTVESVADECGFGDKTALYRAFTRIYGKTPSDYRADCKR